MGRLARLIDNYKHVVPNIVYVETSVPMLGCDELFFSVMEHKCSCSETCTLDCDCICLKKFSVNYVNCHVGGNRLHLLNTQRFHSGSVIECGSLCSCNEFCSNRLVQRGPNTNLKIRHVEGKGWGAFTLIDLKEGTFICEYAGEIVDANDVSETLRTRGGKYLLSLREHTVSGIIETHVDATDCANIGRYLNHSCAPNCSLVPVRIDSPVPRICIFTNRSVQRDEELTYMYGSSDSQLSETVCYCKSFNCKKFLPRFSSKPCS